MTNSYNTVAREGEGGAGAGGAVRQELGAGNTNFDIINSFRVKYNISESLSTSYSLTIWNSFNYDIDGCDEPDGFTSSNADCDGGRSDRLWPTLEVAYELDGLLSNVAELPVSLSVAGGLTALHPAQSADNSGILWPWFYPAFANGRAANNYGSIYIDLIGVY